MPTAEMAIAQSSTDRLTAVVLGASVGVGAAIAKRLLRDGYRVIGFHRGRHERELMEKFVLSSNAEFIALDVGSTFEQVEHGVMALWERRIRSIDVLIHSLSGASLGSSVDMSLKQINKTFNNLAHSFLWWIQGLVRSQMLADNARVIALSNPCAIFPLHKGGVIGAAKAALEAYVKALALELGPRGVRVNAIQFGTVITPAVELLLGSAHAETMKKLIPAGRLQTADDVADFVSLLVRPEAGWINGAVLDATGGMLLTLLDHAYESAKN